MTNAISSVIIVGALCLAAAAHGRGCRHMVWVSKARRRPCAATLVSVNIFGGFVVTQRMLGMYKKKQA